MKILYIVSRPIEINTSASVRNCTTVLGLLENGHEVDIFTTEPDKNHNAYDASLSPAGAHTTYVRLSGMQSIARVGRKYAFLKPLKKLAYKWMISNEIYDNLKGIVNHIDEIDLSTKQYDVIISSSDPKSSHLFVKKLLERKRSDFHGKWIQIWGDPFLGDITLGAKKHAKKIEAEERSLVAAADKVIYVSALTLMDQKKLYPESADKMSYCPIPYSEKKIYPLRDLRTVNPLELVYCGDYNSTVRNLQPLYDAVNAMENVHLTICGNSDKPFESTERVTVYGRVSYAKVIEFEEKADILIHLSNLSGSQIPGKIYQYSGTNKPILFILDGNADVLREQFEKYDRFEFVANDKDEIHSGVDLLCNSCKQYEPINQLDKSYLSRQILEGCTHG